MRAANLSSQFGKFFTIERTLILIFLTGLLLRFVFLDLKLLHHDESIHSWFALRLLTEGIYSYDPVYHGPFLYYATAGIFGILGTDDLITRILPAALGSVLVLLVYPIYRLGYLNKNQTIIAAVFLAVSPDLVYFSRFLRNDIFIIFFTLVILVALLYYIEKKELKYAVLGAVAAGLAMSCKENMPIVLLIFGIYILYLVYSDKFILPDKWQRDLIVSLIIITGIMTAFYSSFGMHPEILYEGLIKAIEHWTSMHGQQRLGGPFYFYIILFLLYELPILILAVAGVIGFFKYRRGEDEKSLVSSEENPENIPVEAYEPEFITSKIKNTVKFDKNREFTRFCIFWMAVSLAVYGYLGEKVPWLILHQLVPMIFVAVYDIQRWKIWLSAAGVVFLIIMTMHVAFTPADISEPIVQVQNSEDLRTVMSFVDSADRVVISDEVRWPFVWYYMEDYPAKVSYYADGYNPDNGPEDYDLLILHDGEKIDEISGYTKYTFKKSYWVDVYGLVQSSRQKADIFDAGYRGVVIDDIKRLISYYFTRDTGIGSINIDVFVKKNSSVR